MAAFRAGEGPARLLGQLLQDRGIDSSLQTARHFAEASRFQDSVNTARGGAQALERQASRLADTSQALASVRTSYTNPVTGASQDTNRTIDRLETDRIRRQVEGVVATFNAAVAAGRGLGSAAVEKYQSVAISDRVQGLGISRLDDGTLAFDERTFSQSLRPGATRLSELRNTLQDLGRFATDAAKAASASGGVIEAASASAASDLSRKTALFQASPSGIAAIFGTGANTNFFA